MEDQAEDGLALAFAPVVGRSFPELDRAATAEISPDRHLDKLRRCDFAEDFHQVLKQQQKLIEHRVN